MWAIGGVALLALTLIAPRLLPTAVPSVDAATVWRDTVVHGTMIRQVRGPGTLVPEQMRWITAETAGRIEEIRALPGTVVDQDDVIMRMSNPDVDMALLQAEQQLSQARAALAQLRTNIQTSELTQRGTVATVRTQFLDAQRIYTTNQRLFDENPNLVARADLDRSKESMEELRLRLQVEEERLAVMEGSAQEQIDAQVEQIGRLENIARFNRDRLQSMQVTVPVGGVLAALEIPLQEGQWVQSGQNLSRVVVPGRLKAEIRITQTQAQDIVIGFATATSGFMVPYDDVPTKMAQIFIEEVNAKGALLGRKLKPVFAARGSVTAGAVLRDGEILVSVSDTGPGIAAPE